MGRRGGKGGKRRDVYLNPQEFNKQLPGMKRDASVYLYNEVVRRCVRADGRERERERGRERERERKRESERARRYKMKQKRGLKRGEKGREQTSEADETQKAAHRARSARVNTIYDIPDKLRTI